MSVTWQRWQLRVTANPYSTPLVTLPEHASLNRWQLHIWRTWYFIFYRFVICVFLGMLCFKGETWSVHSLQTGYLAIESLLHFHIVVPLIWRLLVLLNFMHKLDHVVVKARPGPSTHRLHGGRRSERVNHAVTRGVDRVICSRAEERLTLHTTSDRLA